jgi:hypothetical protein
MAALVVNGWFPPGPWFLVGYLAAAILCALAFRVIVEAPLLAWLRQAWNPRLLRTANARAGGQDN